ncbi:hypothetical protein HMI54_006605, partial [Coelomomyces lativittatus]
MDVEDDLLHLDPITLGIHSLQDEPTEHLREPLPKLDEERLLKPDAFPYLYMSAKKLKFQTTKGKEVENLDTLMKFYKSWAHRVFPKYPFEKFIFRTERLCRSKRLK